MSDDKVGPTPEEDAALMRETGLLLGQLAARLDPPTSEPTAPQSAQSRHIDADRAALAERLREMAPKDDDCGDPECGQCAFARRLAQALRDFYSYREDASVRDWMCDADWIISAMEADRG